MEKQEYNRILSKYKLILLNDYYLHPTLVELNKTDDIEILRMFLEQYLLNK